MAGSKAEREIREAVVAKLRLLRPKARIIHEVNSGGMGSRRTDVMAVDVDEITTVEIKSKKDKLDRLADQIPAMRGTAHHVVVAYHECFLVERETNVHRAMYEREGRYYMKTRPDAVPYSVYGWCYPESDTCSGFDPHNWSLPAKSLNVALPDSALHMLWRDELYDMCRTLAVGVPKRATMPIMFRALRWHATGRDITRGICAALRRREFAEADPPIT